MIADERSQAGGVPGDQATRLRGELEAHRFVMAPGVFECVSARVIAQAGFGAMYITGHGLANSSIAESDVGLLSFGEMIGRAREVIASVDVPAIVDADDGYGGPLNVRRTIAALERAGAAGVQLEDQRWPKKCGHMAGKLLIPTGEMVQKLHAAVDARQGDLVLIARTDALAVDGYDAAIERCHAYVEAGADVVFIDALGHRDECLRALRDVGAPLLVNMVEGSVTEYFGAQELSDAGFAIGIWPISLLLATIAAMRATAEELKRAGGVGTRLEVDRMTFPQFLDFWDYPRIQALEARYALADPAQTAAR